MTNQLLKNAQSRPAQVGLRNLSGLCCVLGVLEGLT
jgi:phospholipase/lecithinase/hemolysin